MEILRSRLLAGHPHGFTTRAGGGSAPPYDSLNLGDQVGDDPAAVSDNWRRLGEATGLGFIRVRQVHGARVVAGSTPTSPPIEEADGVVTATAGVAACVAVADCVPILLARADGTAVAALHAGWRGTLARIAAEGVRSLGGGGGDAPLAVIGPSIGPCCYQVSEELAVQFAQRRHHFL
jgi:hypothetical protein